MYLRFSDADRERFGLADEWIRLDTSALTVAQAEALDDAGGDWTILDDKGAKSAKYRLWMALYQAGVEVTMDDVASVNVGQMRALTDAQMEGKAGTEEASDPADTPTSQTSASSTRRSTRRKSSASQ